MHPNAQLIEKFYSSFAHRNYANMIACYAPDAQFQDEIFSLQGKRIGAMWQMLIEAGKDLRVIHNDVSADDTGGQAHWEAWYTFSASNRPVHNILDAEFQFRDGKIISHRDHFDFWRWSRMALGPSGLLLGWTPIVRNRVRATAAANLEKFIAAHPEYQ